MEFQKALDKDKLLDNRERLNKFTSNKRRYEKEIVMDNNNYLDEKHMEFIQTKEELSFHDIGLIKQVFDFLKEV